MGEPHNTNQMKAKRERIADAKKILKMYGYYTDNLWHIDDVKQNYKVDDDTAYEILDSTLQLDWMIETIFSFIDEQAKDILSED